MLSKADVLVPDWPAPPSVQALQTTRAGGVSAAPYDTLNLGLHVGDHPLSVAVNRQRLSGLLPSEPVWLDQVHGTTVVEAGHTGCIPRADAIVTRNLNAVCVVMTADCLPVLLCDVHGTVVGAAHAGWRGLAGGVIESTVKAMQVDPAQLMAWLGPAIGPQSFEVGNEVRETFISQDSLATQAFTPLGESGDGKYLADLYALARLRLKSMGVDRIYGGGFCTYSDRERFYSYRRDGQTGRMASLIWLGQG